MKFLYLLLLLNTAGLKSRLSSLQRFRYFCFVLFPCLLWTCCQSWDHRFSTFPANWDPWALQPLGAIDKTRGDANGKRKAPSSCPSRAQCFGDSLGWASGPSSTPRMCSAMCFRLGKLWLSNKTLFCQKFSDWLYFWVTSYISPERVKGSVFLGQGVHK